MWVYFHRYLPIIRVRRENIAFSFWHQHKNYAEKRSIHLLIIWSTLWEILMWNSITWFKYEPLPLPALIWKRAFGCQLNEELPHEMVWWQDLIDLKAREGSCLGSHLPIAISPDMKSPYGRCVMVEIMPRTGPALHRWTWTARVVALTSVKCDRFGDLIANDYRLHSKHERVRD